MKKVDARNLSCPQPVLLVKKALEDGEKEIEVMVSSDVSKENVSRFCVGQNCEINEITSTDDGWILSICRKGAAKKDEDIKQKSSDLCHQTMCISSYKIGSNEDLGKLLMEGFINTLPSATRKPRRMLFMNEGVFLTTGESPVIKALKELEDLGVEIKSCGTCLDFYKLKDQLRVGIITNMYDTVEALTSGDVIIEI